MAEEARVTSVETEGLKKAGTSMHDDADWFSQTSIAKLQSLTLPEEAFPVFAWNLVDDYEKVRNGITDVAKALEGAMHAIGNALTNVASHYEEQERNRSDLFTYPG
jgi:hypothetical protein